MVRVKSILIVVIVCAFFYYQLVVRVKKEVINLPVHRIQIRYRRYRRQKIKKKRLMRRNFWNML